MFDLTVFSVYWGNKYDRAYVYALRDMVRQYLTIPHEFICITTDRFDGIRTRNPFVSYSGWWQKIGLFAPTVAAGPSLYFDLDVVITGNIDHFADYTDQFSAPANWAQSGHGGIQSSVMAWPGRWHLPYERFNYQADSKRLWGDQEFLGELLGDDWRRMPGVCSYKYHARQGKPAEPVIVFHGKPDPHEVNDSWILPYTSTLRSSIKSNIPNGYDPGVSAWVSGLL